MSEPPTDETLGPMTAPFPRSSARVAIGAAVAWLLMSAAALAADPRAPIAYTVRIAAPETATAEVEATFPTDGHGAIELMMATWSPGFYRIEHYATRIQTLTAHAPDGTVLAVEQTRPNRWKIRTGRAATVVVSYRLACQERSVTTNWVSPNLLVLNGAATFITLADRSPRPHDVRLELPASLPRSMTALDAAPDGQPHHYRASDFDTLVDSPIVAGVLGVHEFEVDGSRHLLVDAGDVPPSWDGAEVAADLEPMIREVRRFLGFLPFRRYVFLNVFRDGGGGLEHKASTLLTTTPARVATPQSYRGWLGFVAHEYFHAINVKRLRPIELGPFDYERAPRTSSLWISEGFTSYFGSLMLVRGGVTAPADFLAGLSSPIRQLQQAPGRLVQTLEQSSLGVWNNSLSGINPNATTVSYYVKGEIVGFLLDAEIRRATAGTKSLDDVMRLAYQRYGGARGFTPKAFRQTAEEVAHVGLKDWFARAVASTRELDYAPALEWFGLRFAEPGSSDPAAAWRLEFRAAPPEAQTARFRALVAPASTSGQ